MPYHIESDHAECEGFAVVKDEDGEVVGCHRTEKQASSQLAALNIALEYERALPENYRPALSPDVPEGRACGNCVHYNEDNVKLEGKNILAYCELWDEYVDGGFYCNRWMPYVEDDDHLERAPAPPEDQIKGSDVNEPGSAAGAGAEIELNEATETALQNKSDEHNQAMTDGDRPIWTRVTVGKLRSVYRRGSGAYSTSHRPGISRQAWSMARVNAFLYLARTGRPENAKYIGDNDLLHPNHPKAPQERAAPYTPTREMVDEAQQGLDWRAEFNRGGTEIGVARARDIINRRNFTPETIRRTVSFFARHEIDKEGQGFRQGEEGYPSAGRIAWALWGGDPGRTWANQQLKEIEAEENRSHGKRRKEVEKILADLRAVR